MRPCGEAVIAGVFDRTSPSEPFGSLLVKVFAAGSDVFLCLSKTDSYYRSSCQEIGTVRIVGGYTEFQVSAVAGLQAKIDGLRGVLAPVERLEARERELQGQIRALESDLDTLRVAREIAGGNEAVDSAKRALKAAEVTAAEAAARDR